MVHVIVGAGNAVGGIINAAMQRAHALQRRTQSHHETACPAAVTAHSLAQSPSTRRAGREFGNGTTSCAASPSWRPCGSRPHACPGGAAGPRVPDPAARGAVRAARDFECRSAARDAGPVAPPPRWWRRPRSSSPRSNRHHRQAAGRDPRAVPALGRWKRWAAGVRAGQYLHQFPRTCPARRLRSRPHWKKPTSSSSWSRTCRGSPISSGQGRDEDRSLGVDPSSPATHTRVPGRLALAARRVWLWPPGRAVALRVMRRAGEATDALGAEHTRSSRRRRARQGRAVRHADDMAWSRAAWAISWTTSHRGQRIRSGSDPVPLHAARQLLRSPASAGWAGDWRRARGQAGAPDHTVICVGDGSYISARPRRGTSSPAPQSASLRWSSTTGHGMPSSARCRRHAKDGWRQDDSMPSPLEPPRLRDDLPRLRRARRAGRGPADLRRRSSAPSAPSRESARPPQRDLQEHENPGTGPSGAPESSRPSARPDTSGHRTARSISPRARPTPRRAHRGRRRGRLILPRTSSHHRGVLESSSKLVSSSCPSSDRQDRRRPRPPGSASSWPTAPPENFIAVAEAPSPPLICSSASSTTRPSSARGVGAAPRRASSSSARRWGGRGAPTPAAELGLVLLMRLSSIRRRPMVASATR